MATCPTSLFSQMLDLVPRGLFHRLVVEHGVERHSKGFSSWDQTVAMLFCQLAGAKSLREIGHGLGACMGKLNHLGLPKTPARSTLSYANTHRDWQLFRDLALKLRGELFWQSREQGGSHHGFRFHNKLFSLDSSTIDLCLSLFPWAEFRQTKGAVKLHTLLDHDGYFPSFVMISDGKLGDITAARLLGEKQLPKGSIVAMDRGYNDYKLFAAWSARGVYFVTRMKDNTIYEVISERPVSDHARAKGIRRDCLIRLTSAQGQRDCPVTLRLVLYHDAKENRELSFLTNHLNLSPVTIAGIYRERWQIELFFKLLKQHFKIKTFVGTSENALKTQIWTALLAVMLLKYLHWQSRCPLSLSNLVAVLHWHLFSYRDLWAWLKEPGGPVPEPPGEQLLLPHLDSIRR